LVKALVKERVLLGVQATALVLVLVALVALEQGMGLALLAMVVLGAVLVQVWGWALEKELVRVLVERDLVLEWVLRERLEKVQSQAKALERAQA
jgi:hypothetical protein